MDDVMNDGAVGKDNGVVVAVYLQFSTSNQSLRHCQDDNSYAH